MAYQSSKPAFNYNAPNFDVPEKEKTKEWYSQCLRYFSTFYNKYYGIYSTDNPDENVTPVERGMRYSLYYLGKQRNIDYAHVTKDVSGVDLQAVWIKGKKVRQLISHLVGNLINQIENKEIAVKSLSKDALSRKTKMYEDLMLKYDTQSRKIFEQLEQIGITFIPAGDKSFESKEEIERFMEYDWKENTEVVALDIARNIEEQNDASSMYVQAFLEYAAANYCAIYTYVENGAVKQKKIPFYNLIWDHDPNDPFCRNSWFKGFIERMTPAELFKRYPDYFNDPKHREEREEIIKMSADKKYAEDNFPFFNTSNLNWWSFDRADNLTVCVVNMFWKNNHDLRYEKTKDNYGNTHFQRVKKDSKRGEYDMMDVCKAVMVGNRYLVDYGYAENTVRDPKRKGDPELPIHVYSDSTVLGDGVPLIGLVAQNQDRQDFYRFKIMEMIGKDKGKNYVINGNKLGESITSKDLVSDFATMGVHVTPGTSGEYDDMANNQRLVELVDLTLDPNVMRYIELFREEERIMEEIMSIPKIALGQQSTYIGLGTQKGTIAQSTLGLSQLFRNFVKFNEICLQYAINVAKIIYTEPGNEDAAMVIGDRGVKWLKITKDMRFQDLLVFIKTKDVIDEQTRQRLLSYAQAWSQNPVFGISPIDILKLEQAESLTEAINDLEYSIKSKERKAQEAAAAAAQQQAAMQAQEQQAEAAMQGMKEAGDDHRAELQAQTSLANTMIKEGGEEDQNPTKDLPIIK